MTRLVFVIILLANPFSYQPASADRPLTGSDNFASIYEVGDDEKYPLSIAIWKNGDIVWSQSDSGFGEPYYQSTVDKRRLAYLVKKIEKEGALQATRLSKRHEGFHIPATHFHLSAGKLSGLLVSWHEQIERPLDGISVATNVGAEIHKQQSKYSVLNKAPSSYVFFRLVWAESRYRVQTLVPLNGTRTQGKVVYRDGEYYWRTPNEEIGGPGD